MQELPPRDDGLRAALDANVHEGLRLASAVLAGLLGFFAVVDLYITPAPWAFEVAIIDLITGILFLGIFLAHRAGRIPTRRAHVIGTVIAGSVAFGSLWDMYILADPKQTMYLMLVVVGAGSIFLNKPWLYGVVVGSFLGWVGVAASHPSVDWTAFGFAFFAACVLSILIHSVRYTTFERMEAMRLLELSRTQELVTREAALESAVDALKQSEERYRRLVEGAPDAFLVHSEGSIVYANSAAVALLGARDAQDLIGRDAFGFIHPDDRDHVRRRSAAVEKEGRPTAPLEVKVVRLDGSTVDVETRGQPIMYLGRPADQTVIRDMTDRKRAQAEREVALQRLAEISRLQEMDRVKTQFVNTISHELRTPLTPIKVQLHILKGSNDPAVAKRATEVVERNVQRLSGLVDELLEVARIQAGTLRLVKTDLDLSDNVQHALESFEDVARANGIALRAKVEPRLVVQGDAKRLQQVMYNLLGNAFKFTKHGDSIDVEVRGEGDHALVSIADTGAGMEASDIERLFEPFTQIHDVMERTNAGTGLGLYICRGIVEGHDGRIWAESGGRGKGSRFAFTIPLAGGAAE